MYRSCIFCSAALGSNDSIERFPVGRSLAFDGEKGRLWAVCPGCARWNLAPLDERWEAIESAERLFRDTRLRVQRENIGLAKLADGTRLVRVGGALSGELAAWRYGETLVQRRTRYLRVGGAVAAVGAAALLAGVVGAGFSAATVYYVPDTARALWKRRQEGRVLQQLDPHTTPGAGEPITIRRRDLAGARLVETDGVLGIHFPDLLEEWKEHRHVSGGEAVYTRTRSLPLTVTGDAARTLLARAMVHVNARGASAAGVRMALRRIQAVGSPDEFLWTMARRRLLLTGGGTKAGTRLRTIFASGDAEPQSDWALALALEMSLHEETERRVLDGELAMLQAMWREAEEIASIADRLPDLPAPEPPHPRMES